MRVFHKVSAGFDDPNLVSCAGLVPVLALAEHARLHELVGTHVRVPGSAGSNPAAKVGALVAGMVAGAHTFVGMDLLRHGGMDRLFSAGRAPSTLGTFVIGDTLHVLDLDVAKLREVARVDVESQAREQPGQRVLPLRGSSSPNQEARALLRVPRAEQPWREPPCVDVADQAPEALLHRCGDAEGRSPLVGCVHGERLPEAAWDAPWRRRCRWRLVRAVLRGHGAHVRPGDQRSRDARTGRSPPRADEHPVPAPRADSLGRLHLAGRERRSVVGVVVTGGRPAAARASIHSMHVFIA